MDGRQACSRRFLFMRRERSLRLGLARTALPPWYAAGRAPQPTMGHPSASSLPVRPAASACNRCNRSVPNCTSHAAPSCTGPGQAHRVGEPGDGGGVAHRRAIGCNRDVPYRSPRASRDDRGAERSAVHAKAKPEGAGGSHRVSTPTSPVRANRASRSQTPAPGRLAVDVGRRRGAVHTLAIHLSQTACRVQAPVLDRLTMDAERHRAHRREAGEKAGDG